MKYVTFSYGDSAPLLGVLVKDKIVHHSAMPYSMELMLSLGEESWQQMPALAANPNATHYALADVRLHAPLLRPNTLRDFYAFEEHVATANKNREREVPAQWYEIPVFYFSNPHAVYGPHEDLPMPRYTQALDYELEVAAVIGKPGRNIVAANAMEHIFGFMIFNDWSARDVQKQEMQVGLGPAKGKDFASSFGPYLVTPDELADAAADKPGSYHLEMIARINGEKYSRGNWKTLYYSFGEMIARASDEVTLQPGDIIGSGTVGTGCLLELTKAQGPWLNKGDVVELEIERLGVLNNKVV